MLPQIWKWVGCALLAPSIAMATTVIRPIWQEMVVDADFVGIIECTDAGGVVANFKVVESWKGNEEPGAILAFRMQPDVWGPQFPTALCGERYLVTAFKNTSELPSNLWQHEHVPLWWRQIPYDYYMHFPVRRAQPDARSLDPLFHQVPSATAAFKTEVLKLLALPDNELEEHLLRALAVHQLGPKQSYDTGQMQWIDPYKPLRDQVLNASGLEEVLDTLLGAIHAAEESERSAIMKVLKEGRNPTLERLKTESEVVSALHASSLKSVIESIEWKLAPREEDPWNDSVVKPTSAELRVLKETLENNIKNGEYINAINVLATYEPDWLAEYLSSWENPGKDRWDQDSGYWLGSYAIWRCGGDRKAFVTQLLTARESFIQVAGAVYLCFEDLEMGKKYLKDFQTLEGTSGSWAALNLARRGDKSAMPRALEMLASNGPDHMAGVPHRNLQKRLIVLLSNSAKASGLILVDTSDMDQAMRIPLDDLHAKLTTWWTANQKNIVIHDPWLPHCEAQKVD